MRKLLITISAIVLLVLVFVFWFKQTATSPAKKAGNNNQQTNQITPPSFNKTKHSTTTPESIWVVVNKQHSLNPTSYAPNDLVVPDVPLRLAASAEQMHIRKELEAPMKTMFADAKTAGFTLALGSGYRSYSYQKTLYDGYVRTMGQAEADRTSARPGHSEHQTGLAFDVEVTGAKCHLEKCLGETADGKWIAANAYKYGFIVRYTETKEDVTGYDYEPWHLRYVGVELAAELHKQNVETLEEFFNVSGGKNY